MTRDPGSYVVRYLSRVSVFALFSGSTWHMATFIANDVLFTINGNMQVSSRDEIAQLTMELYTLEEVMSGKQILIDKKIPVDTTKRQKLSLAVADVYEAVRKLANKSDNEVRFYGITYDKLPTYNAGQIPQAAVAAGLHMTNNKLEMMDSKTSAFVVEVSETLRKVKIKADETDKKIQMLERTSEEAIKERDLLKKKVEEDNMKIVELVEDNKKLMESYK